MNERPAADEDTMKFGLLMETAQTHQQLAEAHLLQLQHHARGLDGVVRQEIRRTLIEEFQALNAECDRTLRALRRMQQTAHSRGLIVRLGTVLVCTIVPTLIVRFGVPSAADIAALKARRDSLADNVARFEERGGKTQWRNCGAANRLCVRVDKSAPAYGESADYYIVQGY